MRLQRVHLQDCFTSETNVVLQGCAKHMNTNVSSPSSLPHTTQRTTPSDQRPMKPNLTLHSKHLNIDLPQPRPPPPEKTTKRDPPSPRAAKARERHTHVLHLGRL
jgi:hypothetical protein